MPLVKTVRSRGTNIVVEANGELLFVPGGDIARWNNSLSQRVLKGTQGAAPVNKRPRWMHYDKSLKRSFKASTDIDTARMAVYTAVGSTAHYAAFVDQGTKSFQASILPPWTRGSSSLYEHTFKVPEHAGTNSDGSPRIEWNEVGKITVSGQRARNFFAIGLKGGLMSMRVATRNMPGNGGPMMSKALGTFPDRLADFVGNTPWSFAFDTQLREWRSWRDEAWNSGKVLGQGYVRERYRRELKSVRRHIDDAARREQRAKDRAAAAEARGERSKGRSREYREREAARKGLTLKTRRTKAEGLARKKAKEADGRKFIKAMKLKYGKVNVFVETLHFRDGYWFVDVNRSGKRDGGVSEVRAPAQFAGARD